MHIFSSSHGQYLKWSEDLSLRQRSKLRVRCMTVNTNGKVSGVAWCTAVLRAESYCNHWVLQVQSRGVIKASVPISCRTRCPRGTRGRQFILQYGAAPAAQ